MTITPAYINEKLIELLITNPDEIPAWINKINISVELSISSNDAKKYIQSVKSLFAPQPHSPFPIGLNESTLVYWAEINSIVGDYFSLRNYPDLDSIIESYLTSMNWNEKRKVLEKYSDIDVTPEKWT